MSVLLPPSAPQRKTDVTAATAPVLGGTEQQAARRGIAMGRLAAALAVAIVADVVLAVISPFEGLEIACDLGVAFVLCWILGFNWIIVPVFFAEAIPGLDIFPFWTLAVLAQAGMKVGKVGKSANVE